MNNLISYSVLLIIIFSIIISIFSFSSLNYSDYNINENTIYTSSYGFTWPIPNFYTISSYFGPRNSPTVGASSYHKGLDIPASENTYFLASISAAVTYTGFKGAGRIYNYHRK